VLLAAPADVAARGTLDVPFIFDDGNAIVDPAP
jgi:hypothetical protein